MQIDRLIFPITSLGPGNRIVIWTIGCNKNCVKCANPELRRRNPAKDISLELLNKMIKTIDVKTIDGVTITGGEPLNQSDELSKLIDMLYVYTDDILLFTGYSAEELKKSRNPIVDECVKKSSVIVMGEYIDDLNDNKTPLIASSNQMIVFQKKELINRYKQYMEAGRTIQNVFYKNAFISVGIHNRD